MGRLRPPGRRFGLCFDSLTEEWIRWSATFSGLIHTIGLPFGVVNQVARMFFLHFGAKRTAEFISETKVVAEVVDQRLPLFGIDVMLAGDEFTAYVNP